MQCVHNSNNWFIINTKTKEILVHKMRKKEVKLSPTWWQNKPNMVTKQTKHGGKTNQTWWQNKPNMLAQQCGARLNAWA
jgi:hypothetical protein